MNIIDREGYGPLLSCSSIDAIGAPVRLVSPGVVTTADASDSTRATVIGFIISKPSATTCQLTTSIYYSAASGFSGFSGQNGSFGGPVYLTNTSGFSGQRGAITKILGESISVREALLLANPAIPPGEDIIVRKNRILNGGMDVNQRQKTGTLASGDFMVDRFKLSQAGSSTVTFTQSTDVPTAAQAGRTYSSSLRITCTTEASLDASDVISVNQHLEGYDIKDLLGDGYNNVFTISFWAKCSVAGTYSLFLQESTAGRCYIHECQLTTGWTFITHTVSAVPSGGTWLKTNGAGLIFGFTLMCGTTRKTSGLNNSWVSVSDQRTTTNQTFANNGVTADWYFTGVQLEPGPVATPFEWRTYADELRLCQRYCHVIDGTTSGIYGVAGGMCSRTGTNLIESWGKNPVVMRSGPSVSHNNTITSYSAAGPGANQISFYNYATSAYFVITGALTVTGGATPTSFYLDATAGTSWNGTAGDTSYMAIGTAVRIAFDAEL